MVNIEKMTCQFCNEQTPSDYSFCVHCEKQIKCRECGSKTYPGKGRCMECAKPLIDLAKQEQSEQKPTNHFSRSISRQGDNYSETTEFDFTNDAAKIMAPYLLPVSSNKPNWFPPASDKTEEVDFKMIGSNQESNPEKTQEPKENKDSPAQDVLKFPEKSNSKFLMALFQKSGESWVLDNSELKAINKGDFIKRLTCLFLQFRHNNGMVMVPRTEIIALLSYYSAYDGNVRKWFKKERTLMQVTEKELKLIGPGIQWVKQVIEELQDTKVAPGWKIGTVRKRSAKLTNKHEGVENEDGEESTDIDL